MKDEKFESRKADHIQQSLNTSNQVGVSPSEQVRLFHQALPELDFESIGLETQIFDEVKVAAPIFVSSMTAGHKQGEEINETLFEACAEKNWLIGVGSQRKELFDSKAWQEWDKRQDRYPHLKVMGNIGLAQLISEDQTAILKLIDHLKPVAFFVHLNPLQEVLQEEGTRNFSSGLKALKNFCQASPVPVVVKETGCGFSARTLVELGQIEGLYGVDVAGLGGTHWGRIEGRRTKDEVLQRAAETYAFWGHSTAESLFAFKNNQEEMRDKKCWASGGIRNGLDVVTCLSMGAEMVGLAQPFLQAALEGVDRVLQLMTILEYETKVGLFCTGHSSPAECQSQGVWEWK